MFSFFDTILISSRVATGDKAAKALSLAGFWEMSEGEVAATMASLPSKKYTVAALSSF